MGGWGSVGEACRVSGSTSGEPWPRLASHGEPLPNRLPTVLGDSGREPLEMPWKGMGQSGDLGQTKAGLPGAPCQGLQLERQARVRPKSLMGTAQGSLSPQQAPRRVQGDPSSPWLTLSCGRSCPPSGSPG